MMQPLIFHLKELATINKDILQELENEFSMENLHEAFDRRDELIKQMDQIVSVFDKETLSKDEHNRLKKLYNRVCDQGYKIQSILDVKTKEMQQKLGDAIQRRKAEEKYQILK